MSQSSNDNPDHSQPPKNAVILLLGDIADTTWRMFVPTVTLIWLGYWLDKQYNTWPWLFVSGIVVGFAIAGLLVKQQLTKKI